MPPINDPTTPVDTAPAASGQRAQSSSPSRPETRLMAHGSVPEASAWDAIEAALYAPHPFTLTADEATELRLAAIRSSFAYHVRHNAFYRRYCEAAGVTPEAVRGPEDLSQIPLVPEHIFKGCAGPETFIPWLASLCSDEVRWPAGNAIPGSYEQQATTLLQTQGMRVWTTPGTSGTPSLLALDPVTQRRSAHWKILTLRSMYPDLLDGADLVSISLWPLHYQWTDLCVPEERSYALIDRDLGFEKLVETLATPAPAGFWSRLRRRKGRATDAIFLEPLLAQLKERAARRVPTILWTPPLVLYTLARFAQERQLQVELGEHWNVVTSGGWKFLSAPPITEVELRRLASQTFGIPIGRMHELYDVAECLGLCALSCEGGYKHIPPAVLHPLVLSTSMEPLGEGEWGRFAFLNPLIKSYPGFIVTEDRVRLLDRCPACHRTGPVLDAEISPARDGGAQNCGQIVRNIIEERLGS